MSFTTLIRKSTFLRLKQAEFWKPGFMIKKATDKALSDFLDTLPEADKTLPEEELHRLNLKKLKTKWCARADTREKLLTQPLIVTVLKL